MSLVRTRSAVEVKRELSLRVARRKLCRDRSDVAGEMTEDVAIDLLMDELYRLMFPR